MNNVFNLFKKEQKANDQTVVCKNTSYNIALLINYRKWNCEDRMSTYKTFRDGLLTAEEVDKSKKEFQAVIQDIHNQLKDTTNEYINIYNNTLLIHRNNFVDAGVYVEIINN